MKFATLEAVFRALDTARVRFLVVGGVAVNAHGYQRLTQDIDVCLGMDDDNVRAALTALAGLGYRPALPVDLHDFADPATRHDWVAQRNLAVFSLVSDVYRDATIDLMATVPFDFDTEYERALHAEIAPGLSVRFLGIAALIAMKEATGRSRDADDVEHLRMILDELERS